MQIGKLAAMTGVSIRMLRYYESAGLLHPARTETGYRSFTVNDVDVVKRILILNRAGFSLPAIHGLLNCVNAGATPCETLKIKIREQLTRIEHQVETLNESRKLLNQLLTN
ncbi:MerR family transcriptional regulator [Escherichia coli]|uniref:MerR family transcriptional regulator n=1 Tax=Escherichia coli TaxID=562 RepID=UPI0012B8F1A5|nr:MerR family transcriptional regulator [Escherichia coli]EFC1509901.1 MerR family transcriptional regulator [Escherichia coli]EFH4382049.1 MerR family transcriptional regulator [Escherichia coli]EFO0354499.1 MerR family transcriptional regulator [Escherichia coli]EGK4119506.1 MerR family transcriptional regulator [Escherichia coli]EHV4542666.1 MerR family transcriptional regulator [Escherichia coli]